jgi:hypothetical protein
LGLNEVNKIDKGRSGYRFQYGHRFYLINTDQVSSYPFKVWYYSPSVLFLKKYIRNWSMKNELNSHGMNNVFGFKHFVNKGFVFDFNFGFQYIKTVNKTQAVYNSLFEGIFS